MGGNKSDRPEPSHKTGKLRDERIREMQTHGAPSAHPEVSKDERQHKGSARTPAR